jgi:glutathione S-transferase
VNFPDIAKVLTAAGAPPTRTGTSPYTVPAIVDGEKVISDSRKIAEYLERSYPERPVPLQGGAQESAINAFVTVLRPLVVPHVVNHLDERSAAYYIETRRVMLGMLFSRFIAVHRY